MPILGILLADVVPPPPPVVTVDLRLVLAFLVLTVLLVRPEPWAILGILARRIEKFGCRTLDASFARDESKPADVGLPGLAARGVTGPGVSGDPGRPEGSEASR